MIQLNAPPDFSASVDNIIIEIEKIIFCTLLIRLGDGDDVSNQRPCTQRCEDGVCSFSGLQLLPPPPLYRPFQIATEKSSTDLKSKGSSKKATTPKIGICMKQTFCSPLKMRSYIALWLSSKHNTLSVECFNN